MASEISAHQESSTSDSSCFYQVSEEEEFEFPVDGFFPKTWLKFGGLKVETPQTRKRDYPIDFVRKKCPMRTQVFKGITMNVWEKLTRQLSQVPTAASEESIHAHCFSIFFEVDGFTFEYSLFVKDLVRCLPIPDYQLQDHSLVKIVDRGVREFITREWELYTTFSHIYFESLLQIGIPPAPYLLIHTEDHKLPDIVSFMQLFRNDRLLDDLVGPVDCWGADTLGKLQSVLITTIFNPTHHHRIDSICWNECPLSISFNNLTFVEYYKKRYGVEIENMNQPLLSSGGSKLIPSLCRVSSLQSSWLERKRLQKPLLVHTLAFLLRQFKALESFQKDLMRLPLPLNLDFDQLDLSLVRSFVSHSSFISSTEAKCEDYKHYELLEKLGDSVYEASLSTILFLQYPLLSGRDLHVQHLDRFKPNSFIKMFRLFLPLRSYLFDGSKDPSNYSDLFEAFLAFIFLHLGLAPAIEIVAYCLKRDIGPFSLSFSRTVFLKEIRVVPCPDDSAAAFVRPYYSFGFPVLLLRAWGSEMTRFEFLGRGLRKLAVCGHFFAKYPKASVFQIHSLNESCFNRTGILNEAAKAIHLDDLFPNAGSALCYYLDALLGAIHIDSLAVGSQSDPQRGMQSIDTVHCFLLQCLLKYGPDLPFAYLDQPLELEGLQQYAIGNTLDRKPICLSGCTCTRHPHGGSFPSNPSYFERSDPLVKKSIASSDEPSQELALAASAGAATVAPHTASASAAKVAPPTASPSSQSGDRELATALLGILGDPAVTPRLKEWFLGSAALAVPRTEKASAPASALSQPAVAEVEDSAVKSPSPSSASWPVEVKGGKVELGISYDVCWPASSMDLGAFVEANGSRRGRRRGKRISDSNAESDEATLFYGRRDAEELEDFDDESQLMNYIDEETIPMRLKAEEDEERENTDAAASASTEDDAESCDVNTLIETERFPLESIRDPMAEFGLTARARSLGYSRYRQKLDTLTLFFQSPEGEADVRAVLIENALHLISGPTLLFASTFTYLVDSIEQSAADGFLTVTAVKHVKGLWFSPFFSASPTICSEVSVYAVPVPSPHRNRIGAGLGYYPLPKLEIYPRVFSFHYSQDFLNFTLELHLPFDTLLYTVHSEVTAQSLRVTHGSKTILFGEFLHETYAKWDRRTEYFLTSRDRILRWTVPKKETFTMWEGLFREPFEGQLCHNDVLVAGVDVPAGSDAMQDLHLHLSADKSLQVQLGQQFPEIRRSSLFELRSKHLQQGFRLFLYHSRDKGELNDFVSRITQTKIYGRVLIVQKRGTNDEYSPINARELRLLFSSDEDGEEHRLESCDPVVPLSEVFVPGGTLP